MNWKRAWAVVAAGILLAGCTAPTPSPTESPTVPSPPPAPAPLPDPAEPLPIEQLAWFSGVAELNAGSNCTGTLIDTGAPDGPAYLLTNGHCVGDVGRSAQNTTIEHEWFGTATFLQAKGYQDNALEVEVVQLAYSTMRHTDTAIVRLKPTLGELEQLGLRPIPITATEPAEGAAVTNIGVPTQDLNPDDWVLRRGECTLGAQHTLIEALWMWFGVWSNNCPGIIQGSSGSPLLSLDADGHPAQIVGMINTTTGGTRLSDGGACSLNRPCEVAAEGPRLVEDTSYAQSVAGLGGCFTANGDFALGKACPLPVSSIWVEAGGGSFRGGNLPDAHGRMPEASLVGRKAGPARTALVPLGDGTACLKPETYASAEQITVAQAGYEWERLGTNVPVNLPETEGHFTLCAVTGDDYAGAASVLFEVDRTPPIFPATAEVEDIGGGTVIVRPHLNPPELTTFRFTWGDPKTIDCEDTSSFQDFFIIPLTLTAEDLPASYCIYGMDGAGNPTDTTRIEIPKP